MTDEHRDGTPDPDPSSPEESRPAYGGPPRRRRGRRGYEGQQEWKDKRAEERSQAESPAASRHEDPVTPSEPVIEERPPRPEPAFGPEASASAPGITREEPRRDRFRRRGGMERRRGFDRPRDDMPRGELPPRDDRPPREDRPPRDDRVPREDRPPRDDRVPREDRPPRDDRPPREDRRAREDRPPREDRGTREDRPPREDRGTRDDRPPREARPPLPLPPRAADEAAREDRPRRDRDRRGRDRRELDRREPGARGDTPREPREPGARGDTPREPRDPNSRSDTPRELRQPNSRGDAPREPRRDRGQESRSPQSGPRAPHENERQSAMPHGQGRPQPGGGRRNDGPRRGRDGGRRDSRGSRPSASSALADHPLKPTSVLTLPPKPIRVMIVGGGTGGHITPALSIGEALKARNPQTELLFVGSDRGMEREMIGKAGFRLEEFSLSGLPTRPTLAAFKQTIQLLQAYQRIKRLIGEFKPDVVVGTGGYVTVPGALAAKTSRVPLVLQEQNSVPGKANRLLSRWASEVHIHFTESRRFFKDRGKLRLSGNPVRIRIPEGRGLKTMQKYRLHPDRKTVLILGGSQGAHSLNQAFIDMLPHFRNDRDVQFVIQTGKQDYNLVLNSVRDSAVRVVVKSFLHQIEEIYGVTSLVLARAGAMTVSEISACGLPSILVPYPYAADDHQTANARALSDKGAAVLLRDQDLTGERMAQEIRKLLADTGRLREMGRFAYSLSRPDAARRIAESVERLGGGAPEAVLNLPEEYDEIEEAEAKH
jgi:UDP-N-acetylglucosamine--N-acetylmuramyl-(pentapeptide) pyrophosphoryl-undecaprenol N-acetylglucosamine transferase